MAPLLLVMLHASSSCAAWQLFFLSCCMHLLPVLQYNCSSCHAACIFFLCFTAPLLLVMLHASSSCGAWHLFFFVMLHASSFCAAWQLFFLSCCMHLLDAAQEQPGYPATHPLSVRASLRRQHRCASPATLATSTCHITLTLTMNALCLLAPLSDR